MTTKKSCDTCCHAVTGTTARGGWRRYCALRWKEIAMLKSCDKYEERCDEATRT